LSQTPCARFKGVLNTGNPSDEIFTAPMGVRIQKPTPGHCPRDSLDHDGSMAGGVSMVEILNSGLIESDDLDLTHWWVIRDAGTEILYVGTPETFTTYIRERNGGIQ
jgi:hypothetical protein